ncbi:hypothetical protein LIER_29850 [Lithospermum erythrorhizon]|uniref:Uncharacterized protein n=1 Tax=Lithospermum erythrorhizon TaxID=34254 RepID=A0AAV3RNV0_LITER
MLLPILLVQTLKDQLTLNRKGFRSLFEAGLDAGFAIAFGLERLPLSQQRRSRRSESKGQRVIFEGYYASLLIVEFRVGLGIAGLEPATIRLKAQCSTN